jgi:hypothetical protein
VTVADSERQSRAAAGPGFKFRVESPTPSPGRARSEACRLARPPDSETRAGLAGGLGRAAAGRVAPGSSFPAAWGRQWQLPGLTKARGGLPVSIIESPS